MDSPAMQIKKMKDVGQQLYSAHTSDGCHPATMSPKPLGAHRLARAQRPEPPGLVYPETEASLTTLATCAKCHSVQETPIHELKKTQRADKYICFQCTLSGGPFPFGSPSGLRGNPAQLASAGSKFKVRNFKPGKYYCDKCRFSTKDPLQYKKHITQHDEIRFICSHCSYVSYTKGEFQRHLVKHTGIFPYQCEYCDYGAVRNDYIVKHRKRVHERAGGRRPLGPPTKLEVKRAGATKPYPELGKPLGAPRREALPGGLSEALSRFPVHPRKDRARGVTWLPDPEDFQKDLVCIPKQLGPAEPNEVPLFENKSVEVEVLSPAREPLQPGMPLTVVAPSELVVPANCLAQLMDVKVVNGTQQVLLKLFPLEENSGLEGRPGDAEVSGKQGLKEKGPCDPGKGGPAELPRAPGGDGCVERLAAGMKNLPTSLQKHLRGIKWLRSCDLLMSHPGVHSPSEPPTATEEMQERSALCPYQASLPSLAFRGPFPPSSMVKNSVFCGLGAAPGPFPYQGAALSEERQHLARDSKRLLPLSAPPLALPFSSDQGPLPQSKVDLESRRKFSVPGKSAPLGRKLKDCLVETSSACPAPSPYQSEYLQISLAGEGPSAPPQPGDRPLELTTAERTPESFEGPVISSVFSLSSGSEDVPEGIRWNSATAKVKSVELLRRKIAKLIESCGRRAPLATSSMSHHPAGPMPEERREICTSVAGPSYTSASPPDFQDERAVEALAPRPKAHPQSASATGSSGKTEGRGGRRAHAATSALVPRGRTSRILNSSEDAHMVEATCDPQGTVPRGEAQSSQLVSSRPAQQTDTDPLCLMSEGRPGGLAPTPDTTLRLKPRKESAMCGITPRRNGALYHGPQGLGDSGRHRKLLSRSLTLSKSKSRQGNAGGKKKGHGQAELGRCLKDPSIFQVARQLRLVAARPNQLIKCPRRNQPVIVLNHPDVDSPEVTNVMKVINKYKGNVLKVVLSERTRCQLGIRRRHVRLTYQNAEEANQIKRQMMLKMKLKKVHKNNYQVVDALPDDSAQCLFKCWFCGRLYEDQEEWMSHGQRHLIEATRDWDVLSSKGK